jgi:pectate lyase
MKSFICIFLLAWACAGDAATPLGTFAKKTDDWYRSEEGRRIAENILSWQSDAGSWPKNTNTTAKPFSGDRNKIQGTFDNSATTGELRFLARSFRVTHEKRCEESFRKGFDHILQAQYPTGGWPQLYPPGTKYHRHITFNDDAMVRLMEFLREVATSTDYEFVDSTRRKAAQESFQRGVQCILKCQITVNGKLTVWCAQHDEIDYSPRPARTFELVSLSGGESAGILELLMSLDHPGPEVIRAIKAGVQWYESSKLTGIRQESVNGDKRIVRDPNASPLWARFYEIESNRPIFSGRDSVKKYDVAEIESERRNGYAWYGKWGERVAASYAKWTEKWPEAARAESKTVRIVIIGDSTVCNYPENVPTRGWGQFVQGYFNDAVAVVNWAKSGRSTKTFIKEGLWKKALTEKPDFVLIQFGHNDSHATDRPEATSAAGDFRDYLRGYIDESRAAGATPILVTPMHRRTFDKDGKLTDILGPYAEAMKEVGAEKKVAVVDLHAASGKLFQQLGDAASAEMANQAGDRTHFNEKGARAMAELVMQELPTAAPPLKKFLR